MNGGVSEMFPESEEPLFKNHLFSLNSSDAVMLGELLFLCIFAAIILHRKAKDSGCFTNNKLH